MLIFPLTLIAGAILRFGVADEHRLGDVLMWIGAIPTVLVIIAAVAIAVRGLDL